MAKREPPNISKPLPNRVVRGLLRALMTINGPPQRRATQLDVPTRRARGCDPSRQNFHSPNELRTLLSRLTYLHALGARGFYAAGTEHVASRTRRSPWASISSSNSTRLLRSRQ
jgi:hypothetical protein